jgi:hypothetical protein
VQQRNDARNFVVGRKIVQGVLQTEAHGQGRVCFQDEQPHALFYEFVLPQRKLTDGSLETCMLEDGVNFLLC